MHPFCGLDEVVVVVGPQVDLHPVYGTVEHARCPIVVLGDRRGGLTTYIGGLIAGEDIPLGAFYAALTDLVSIIVDADVAALSEAAAVVGKLQAYLVLA